MDMESVKKTARQYATAALALVSPTSAMAADLAPLICPPSFTRGQTFKPVEIDGCVASVAERDIDHTQYFKLGTGLQKPFWLNAETKDGKKVYVSFGQTLPYDTTENWEKFLSKMQPLADTCNIELANVPRPRPNQNGECVDFKGNVCGRIMLPVQPKPCNLTNASCVPNRGTPARRYDASAMLRR